MKRKLSPQTVRVEQELLRDLKCFVADVNQTMERIRRYAAPVVDRYSDGDVELYQDDLRIIITANALPKVVATLQAALARNRQDAKDERNRKRKKKPPRRRKKAAKKGGAR